MDFQIIWVNNGKWNRRKCYAALFWISLNIPSQMILNCFNVWKCLPIFIDQAFFADLAQYGGMFSYIFQNGGCSTMNSIFFLIMLTHKLLFFLIIIIYKEDKSFYYWWELSVNLIQTINDFLIYYHWIFYISYSCFFN